MNALDATSTRPYLIRALYEWCTDNGFTPYVAVSVDDTVQVPREYVKNNEIVLNISFDATSSLKLGNEFIEFKARFAGSAREIMVPVGRVIAIYARENGQGMAFPMPVMSSAGPESPAAPAASGVAQATPASAGQGQAADGKIMQLVPTEPAASAEEGEGVPPEPPKSPKGGRPSLKRVK
ncbi:ClpXP protease specificity-enhancing factor [Polaromonas sp.]|uniref:ClpXP protease specificity-enhancing factor n=1 Tax=Polaromonas sp. TaxID=1869339 RepID=UPI002FCCA670